MELDKLKKNWQQSNVGNKNQIQLNMMTQIQQHSKFKRIKIKLIFEAILILGFVFFYNNMLDGGDKPMWVNLILIGSAVLFILSDVIGYFIIQNPIKANDLHSSIQLFCGSLKKVSIFSTLSTFLFGGSLILFMVSTIELTESKN